VVHDGEVEEARRVIDLNKGNRTGQLQVLDAKLAGHTFGCTISAAVFFFYHSAATSDSFRVSA
jgi:hypothetical protein